MFILLPLPGVFASIEGAQLGIAVLTFVSASIGGFLSAYIGVKVALARIEARLAALSERIQVIEQDVRRLEDSLFFNKSKA